MRMKIREMQKQDLAGAAAVHQINFVRQTDSLKWITCNYNAAPRFLNFVVEMDNQVVAYICWVQKSGFRPEAVVELEQLAVLPSYHGQGVATALIKESLVLLKQYLQENGRKLKHILVTTRADNAAQRLYQRTLNASVEVTVCNLYSADEVLMIARDVSD